VQQLLSVMAIFIQYPVLAAIIGLLLLGLGRWIGRRLVTAVGVIWLLYAAYETGMQQRWLCSGECNIRVDLLLIYPLLLVMSAAAVASMLRAGRARRPRA
jgi:hypothetical protein